MDYDEQQSEELEVAKKDMGMDSMGGAEFPEDEMPADEETPMPSDDEEEMM